MSEQFEPLVGNPSERTESEESKPDIPIPKSEQSILEEEILDVDKRKRIVLRPCLKNTQLAFTITKTKIRSFFSKHCEEFKCYLTFGPHIIVSIFFQLVYRKNTLEKDLVMVARKYRGCLSTKYVIGINENYFKGETKSFLGKLM
jgi:hypothetical protein